MLFEEVKKEEYNAGKAEGIEIGKVAFIQSIKSILSAKGNISGELTTSIESISDLQRLQELVVIAANVSTIDEFQKELSK